MSGIKLKVSVIVLSAILQSSYLVNCNETVISDVNTTAECVDDNTWEDRDGFNCDTYMIEEWCIDGGYGKGWDPFWGTFLDYVDANGVDATSKCCACRNAEMGTHSKKTRQRECPQSEDMTCSLPTNEEEEESDPAMDEIVQWLLDNGAKFPKLQLKSYKVENGDQVRGVISEEEIPNGELIVEIPLKCLYTVEDGKQTLEDRENADSFYQPYHRILPPTLSNVPLFWNADQLKSLEGSSIMESYIDRWTSFEIDYKIICSVAPSFKRFSLEEFAYARMIVSSRNFGITVNGVQTSAMVPFADLLNHRRPVETTWGFDQSRNAFTISSIMDIADNSPVYDSYGPKSNFRFFFNYGFTVEHNVEEDGLSPDDLLLTFDFNVHDPLVHMKKAILKGSAFIDTATRLRINTDYQDDNVYTAFGLMRLIVADESDLNEVFSRGGDRNALVRLFFEPLGLDNEIRVLQAWNHLARDKLDKYPMTIEEDKESLKSYGNLPPFSNERNAVVAVLSEKAVLHHYLTLLEVSQPFFAMGYEEALNLEVDDSVLTQAETNYLATVLMSLWEQEQAAAGPE